MRRVLLLTTFVLSSLSLQQSHAQDFLYRLPGDHVSSFYGIDLGNGLALGYGLGYSVNASAGTPVMSDTGGTMPDRSDGVEPLPKVSQAYIARQMQKKQQLAEKIAKRRGAEALRLKTMRERKAEAAQIPKPEPEN